MKAYNFDERDGMEATFPIRSNPTSNRKKQFLKWIKNHVIDIMLLSIWTIGIFFVSFTILHFATEQKHSHLTIMKAYELGYVQGRLNELLCKSEEESKIQWKIDSLKVDSMLLYP